MTVDELHTSMDAEFKAVRAEMKTEGDTLRRHIETLRAEMKAEGETTRRHFDVVAEHFKEYTRVLADGTARNTERIDDHEIRMTTLEGRSS